MIDLHILACFLLQTIVISLSGVLAPGPVTAATLASGTRARHAGALIAIGHGLVEFPLMLLILAGIGPLLRSGPFTIGVGLLGGAFLVIMGVEILRGLGSAAAPTGKYAAQNPIWIGVVLSAGNPYFLLWWASVGLALSTRALEIGRVAFALFALVHWLCDLVWLEALSLAGFKGTKLLGGRVQQAVLIGCAIALLVLGVSFMWDGLSGLVAAWPSP